MRRVGFFAAFLLLLGLTTATAASFDVQAEDITSFTTDVSIEVPTTTTPPPMKWVFYLVDPPQHATLATVEPTTQGGNHSVTLGFGPTGLDTTNQGRQGNRIHYVAWKSAPIPDGLPLAGATALLTFTRTAASPGEILAGLFTCEDGAPAETVNGHRCTSIGTNRASGETISIALDGGVMAGHQLRLKMVSATDADSAIQWGYKVNNRPARIEITR